MKWALWLPNFHHFALSFVVLTSPAQLIFICYCCWFLFVWFWHLAHLTVALTCTYCTICLWPLHTSNSIAYNAIHMVWWCCYRFNGNHQHIREMMRPMSVSVAMAYGRYLHGFLFCHRRMVSRPTRSTPYITSCKRDSCRGVGGNKCQMTKHNCDGEVFFFFCFSSSSVLCILFFDFFFFYSWIVHFHVVDESWCGQCRCSGVVASLLE